jgi:purine-binding chemotaxis protein CheW
LDEINEILEEDQGMADKYMTFAVGNESYGLDIEFVSEIIMVQTITEVPEVPSYIRGIVNLRGKILTVMDVRRRFGKENAEYNDRTCIIVTNINDNQIGLIVDTVQEVIDIPPEDITAPASNGTDYQNKYIKGIGKTDLGIKLILDLDPLVSDR